MATTTLTDLAHNRALDHQAMAAIRGASGAPWVFGAFRAFLPDSARIAPVVNFYQTNIIAEQLNLQLQNINVENTGANAVINLSAAQNALNFNIVPMFAPQP